MSIIALLGCIAISFCCDWIDPEQVPFIAYSFFLISVYAARNILYSLLILELLEMKHDKGSSPYGLIALIPVVINGVLLISGLSFNAILVYARILAIAQTALSMFLAARHFLRGGKQTSERDSLSGLSRREIDVANLMLEGKRTDDIAGLLFISTATVKTHIQNIFRKYGVSNRMEFANKVHNHSNG